MAAGVFQMAPGDFEVILYAGTLKMLICTEVGFGDLPASVCVFSVPFLYNSVSPGKEQMLSKR